MSFHDQSVSPAIPSPPLEQQDLMLTKPAQPDHVEDKKIVCGPITSCLHVYTSMTGSTFGRSIKY